MSKLYGSITADASSTDATRRAHRNIVGHIRGWNVGIQVAGYLDGDGNERLEVYLTSGSSDAGQHDHLGTAYLGAGGATFAYTAGRDADALHYNSGIGTGAVHYRLEEGTDS